MRISRRLYFSLVTLAVSASISGLNAANIISQSYSGPLPTTISGTLPNEGTALEQTFTLAAASAFTAYTTSYANGGFEPNLTLFNASGNYVAGPVPPGSSPIAKPDSTGKALDAYLTVPGLAAGTYILALTDWELNQGITATNLSDGFTANYGDGVNFVDQNGDPRSGAYSLTLTTATPAAAPEPATLFLIGPLFIVFGSLAIKKKVL